MPTLAFHTRVPQAPHQVEAECFATREAFEGLLPRYLARVRVTYAPGDRVMPGTVVEFRPWLFPGRWRVVSHLRERSPGAWVWEWREGPLRGTETWVFEGDGQGGTRFTRRVDYLVTGRRERWFWTLVATPAHTLVALLERRRLKRWGRRSPGKGFDPVPG
ncbi:MAG TPA: hypothetical protein VNZ52_16175 [Candidatus Thermoplasmatota archaeon]|nr:hypothetical protein [Candidatus Thermoplasmatota archaeon]